MSHVSQRSNRLVVVAVFVAVVMAAAACDDNNGPSKVPLTNFGSGPLVSTIPFTTSIFPPRLGITPIFGLRCPTLPSVTTRFDLVIIAVGRDLFLDEVTLSLLDGSNRGGSPLLVSARDLNARFASTLIPAGTRRTFGFDPQFGCGRFLPLSLEADVVLLERSGFRHTASISVPVD
jgi:hypothetical protein